MSLNYAEQVAKSILEEIYPGSRMDYRLDQSHGEWDFDLKYENGEIAAVEVTSSHNRALTQIQSEIFRKQKNGSRIQALNCKLTWLIRPAFDANIKNIRKNADMYLAVLEEEGLSEFSGLDLRRPNISASLAKIRDDLRLDYGKAIAVVDSPEIRLLGIVSGVAVGPRTATKAAENEFEANREKLGRAGFAERHLFVHIDQMNGGPWIATVDFVPPGELPTLPKEITHVWVLAQVAGDEFIVWYGNENQPWQKKNIVTLSTTRVEGDNK